MQQTGPLKKVGVLGGTFDPVHLGHLVLARFVREFLALDEFIFIPAARPPHKVCDDLTPFADRYRMLRLALRDDPAFAVSDLEAARQGPSYSVDTLTELHRRYGANTRFFFVIGLDAFLELQTWKNYRMMPRLADLVVINRTDCPDGSAADTIVKLGDYRLNPYCNCWVSDDLPGRIYLLEMKPVEISSTMVRKAVNAGQPINHLVPAEVAGYIRHKSLYSS